MIKKMRLCLLSALCVMMLCACTLKETGTKEPASSVGQMTEEETTREPENEAGGMGNFDTPLPVGEFGYLKSSSPYTGDYEIELRVNQVLRGESAKEQVSAMDASLLQEQKEGQEFMLVNVTANLPSANFKQNRLLPMDANSFKMTNSHEKPTVYGGAAGEYQYRVYTSPYDMCAVAPGGTVTGWIAFLMEETSDFPVMYYKSLDDQMLFFQLDPSYVRPEVSPSYESSPVFSENPIRDENLEKGDWRNPYSIGEEVELNYSTEGFEEEADSFTGSIRVLEAYKGKQAEKFMDPVAYKSVKNMELIVLRIKADVAESEGDRTAGFDGSYYTVLDGQGGQVATDALVGKILESDGIVEVGDADPGEKAEGYTAFFIPKGNDHLVMTYGHADRGLVDDAWISLEFAD